MFKILTVKIQLVAVLLILIIPGIWAQSLNPVDLVNPFIDTHKSRWFFFNSACRPFGMINLSPDTDTEETWNSGYLYGSKYIRCFSHIHAWQLSGIAVMPTVGEFRGHKGMEAYKSNFSHEGEIAKPGYHKIFLDDYKLQVELTSTTRVGFHKYTFPKTDSAYINFHTGAFLAHGGIDSSYIRKINANEIEGFSLLSRTDRRPKSSYIYFMNRSENYNNLWNPENRLIHPRNIDSSWIVDFSPIDEKFNSIGFCESNSAIYTNYVPHNLNGLISLFGGKESYTAFLESSFDKASANKFIAPHGKHARSWVDYENQPSCQMAHLFNFSGSPWLTQKWVRKVKEITFGDITPYGGYNGDEDQGQMGALGVLMAVGLFQMDGGASINSPYEITSPLFDNVTISLNSWMIWKKQQRRNES